MLSDDITKTVSSGVTTVGNVISSAVRGGIMFGILALAAVSIAVALPALFGAASVGAAFGAFLLALPTAAVGAGLTAAGIGAMAGATLMGISSLIPGSKEGLSPLKIHGSAVNNTVNNVNNSAYGTTIGAQQRAAGTAITNAENPYFREGLGATLAQKGSDMTNGHAK